MATFFKWLWRVNAVLALLALVAVIVAAVLLSNPQTARPLLAYFVSHPRPPAPERPSPDYVLEPDIVIGADTNEANFDVYRLVRWGSLRGRPATADAATIVNLLVIDKKTNATHWLFRDFDRSIIVQEPVLTGRWYWHEPEIDDDIPVELMVLKVIDADSNHDGVLGTDDRQTLYVARFAATPVPPEKLLTADQIWFTAQRGNEYHVGYRDRGQGYLAVYSLPDFQLKSQTRIAGLPH